MGAEQQRRRSCVRVCMIFRLHFLARRAQTYIHIRFNTLIQICQLHKRAREPKVPKHASHKLKLDDDIAEARPGSTVKFYGRHIGGSYFRFFFFSVVFSSVFSSSWFWLMVRFVYIFFSWTRV